MTKKVPDRLYVRESDWEKYKMLRKETSSFLCNQENKEIFIMAMIYGFMNNSRCGNLGKAKGFVREEYLSDEYRTLMKAIAVKESGSLDVLLDPQKIHSIAEEYAAGGIDLLKNDVLSKKGGSYSKRLEELLVELHEKTA